MLKVRYPQALAEAIVMQAVKDYKRAVRMLAIDPESKTYQNYHWENRKNEVLLFFRSEWYGIWCDIDPDRMIAY